MLMAAFERIREIGVSKALGVGPLRIFGTIVLEAAFQAGIASGIGVALGVPTLLTLARNGLDLSFMGDVSVVGIAMQPIWYPDASLASYAGPVTALLTITFVAVVFPAWKAARIDPVEALHHR
jgi:putative ABC transport system permease protein